MTETKREIANMMIKMSDDISRMPIDQIPPPSRTELTLHENKPRPPLRKKITSPQVLNIDRMFKKTDFDWYHREKAKTRRQIPNLFSP